MTATDEKTTVRFPAHLYEEWRPVPGTYGMYEVSSLGRMRTWVRVKRIRRDSPNMMKPTIGKRGYRVWCHRLDGHEKRSTVHRAVALAFHGDPGPGRWEVRHLDNDNLNNMASNLAWGTPAENAADRVAARTTNRGERSPFAKLTWDKVREVRRVCHTVGVGELAQQHNVTRATITRIIRNETWQEWQ